MWSCIPRPNMYIFWGSSGSIHEKPFLHAMWSTVQAVQGLQRESCLWARKTLVWPGSRSDVTPSRIASGGPRQHIGRCESPRGAALREGDFLLRLKSGLLALNLFNGGLYRPKRKGKIRNQSPFPAEFAEFGFTLQQAESAHYAPHRRVPRADPRRH